MLIVFVSTVSPALLSTLASLLRVSWIRLPGGVLPFRVLHMLNGRICGPAVSQVEAIIHHLAVPLVICAAFGGGTWGGE